MADSDTLRQAFVEGLVMARDPRNAGITDDHTPRVTTIYSAWYRTACSVCHHTFREDDRVVPHPQQPSGMIHKDPAAGLCCWSRLHGHRPNVPKHTAATTAIRDAFLQGLHTHWNPDDHVQCLTVEPRSPLIGKRCPICRHTVRPGDRVVRCPCGRACGGVFHQDISRHLTCWDTWNRSTRRHYCAFTGAPLLTEGTPL